MQAAGACCHGEGEAGVGVQHWGRLHAWTRQPLLQTSTQSSLVSPRSAHFHIVPEPSPTKRAPSASSSDCTSLPAVSQVRQLSGLLGSHLWRSPALATCRLVQA